MNTIAKRKGMNGFTLVELMVVVAIVAIISAIAIPSYQDQVRKSRRSDAKASLMDLSQQLERCFTMNGQYTTVAPKNCPAVDAGGALTTTTSLRRFYTLDIPVLSNTTFTIRARPTGFTDPQCTAFTLSNTGVRDSTPAPAPGALNRCWDR